MGRHEVMAMGTSEPGFLMSINEGQLSEEDLAALQHAREVLRSVRHADYSSGDGRRKLRVLTRYVSGTWSAERCAEALGWEIDRVAEEAEDWLSSERHTEPLSACWLRPAQHPWIAHARKIAEARADQRDLLWARLILRMKAAKGLLAELDAATRAGLSVQEWALFCASEDAAPPSEDSRYREGWIFEGESNPTPADAEDAP